MFETREQFQAYLEETKAKCPEAPEPWEKITHPRPTTGGDLHTCCTSYMKVVPDYEILASVSKVAFSTARADAVRHRKLQLVRVQPCHRGEATHVRTTSAGIIWLGLVTRTHSTYDGISAESLQSLAEIRKDQVRDARSYRITVAARQETWLRRPA